MEGTAHENRRVVPSLQALLEPGSAWQPPPSPRCWLPVQPLAPPLRVYTTPNRLNLLHVEAKRVKIPRSLKAEGARAHLHVLFYTLGFPWSSPAPFWAGPTGQSCHLFTACANPIWNLKSAETLIRLGSVTEQIL